MDEAPSKEQALKSLDKLTTHMEKTYQHANPNTQIEKIKVQNGKVLNGGVGSKLSELPSELIKSISLLPLQALPWSPLKGLLEGFRMDLKFPNVDTTTKPRSDDKDLTLEFPIATEKDLDQYAFYVAGTVAELLLNLVYYHSTTSTIRTKEKERVIQAGVNMGKALQYINIARDISKDARENARCYLPTSWLNEIGLEPQDVIKNPGMRKLNVLRKRLLNMAMEIYRDNVEWIERLPQEGGARQGVRAAVENYVEIGRVLMEKMDQVDEKSGIKEGIEKCDEEDVEADNDSRATVGRGRRLRVFIQALWKR